MDMTYMTMRAYLYPREQQQTVSFKQHELEQVWFCTSKNVKRLLKKYQESGLFVYEPGRGRGNASKLHFGDSFHEEVTTYVNTLIQKDQMEQVIKLLQLNIPKQWVTELSGEIQTLFGFHNNQKKGDVLRSIVARELTTLDPLYTSVTLESYLIHQLSDTLVLYDQIADKIKPHLAHHWVVSDDYAEWTFYLRKGVKFHHQVELTGLDVVHTFTRFQFSNSPLSWLVNDIVAVEAISDYTVRFMLAKPNPFFLRYLTTYSLGILPRDIPFDEYKWIGTGPFQLKERTDRKLSLAAFNDYFLDRPLLDEVEFWKIPEGSLPAATFQIEGRETSAEVHEYEEIEVGFRMLAFNFHRPTAVQDPSFRQAIYHLVDVEKMFKELGRDKPIAASSYFHWISEKQEKQSGVIKQLLEQSAYRGEAIQLYSLDYEKAIDEAKWIVREGRKYGIQFVHNTMSIEAMYDDHLEQQVDLILFGEVASNDYQLSFLESFNNKALMFRRLFDAEHLAWIDRQLEEFKWAESSATRIDIIKAIEAYIRSNQLLLYLFHPIKRRTFHPMIKSVHFEAYGQINLRKLWIPVEE
ncbi:ABC transporter substrate-binding protein [Radiobacillus sp. PE A8.2]|uniref:ABC transporter substrate-binding protein n=1 Tax=Radiobacillus sp. PE A8.2 TaxID=3380349 RepID=UPI00388F8A7D